MRTIYDRFLSALYKIRFLPPLFFRWTLAAIFYGTFLNKIEHVQATAEYFAQLGFPLPKLSVYVSIIIEGVGALFLFLGFATRLASIFLIALLIVAITTVHLPYGFSCANGGYELPFYYILMLFSLLIGGAGGFSMDALIRAQARRK